MKIFTKKCIVCDKEYVKKYTCSKREWELSKYCSRDCSNKGKIGKVAWNKGVSLDEDWRRKLCGPRPEFVPWNKNTVGLMKPNSGSFQKGHKPWHAGTKGIKKQRKWSEEEKKEIAKRLSGSKSHFWKGGISNENHRIRQTIEYREWRTTVFKRDNYTCQMCHRRGGKLQADHIKPFAKYSDLRFKLSNGRTLCIPCHKQTSTYAKNLR